jgi:CBS domain containing-hemolysin-like protein
MAFVTIEKPELRERAWGGVARAKSLLEMRESPEKALSVIQIGITLVGAVSAAVSGVLHSKEFLASASAGNQDWQSIVRGTVNISGSDNLLAKLRRLQEPKKHMGIVYEGDILLGIVTIEDIIEDIIEEVIGDIFDEDDEGLVRKLLASRQPTSSLKSSRLEAGSKKAGLEPRDDSKEDRGGRGIK